eukprot:5147725-Amphidinium_carterae.1
MTRLVLQVAEIDHLHVIAVVADAGCPPCVADNGRMLCCGLVCVRCGIIVGRSAVNELFQRTSNIARSRWPTLDKAQEALRLSQQTHHGSRANLVILISIRIIEVFTITVATEMFTIAIPRKYKL